MAGMKNHRISCKIAFLLSLLIGGPATAREKGSATIDTIRSLSRALEFEAVIEQGNALLGSLEALPHQDAIELLYTMARAHISRGDLGSAQKLLVRLLRMDLTFEPPEGESPAIVALFRKVQVEEEKRREKVWQEKLDEMRQNISLQGGPSSEAIGGQPLEFQYQLQDPGRSVGRLELSFRKDSTELFSTLPLVGTDEGHRAEVPAEWTENEEGLRVEYFVSGFHLKGETLLRLGTPQEPLALALKPGMREDHLPLTSSPWFWIGGGLIGTTLLGVSGVLIDALWFESKVDGQLGEIPLESQPWLYIGTAIGLLVTGSALGAWLTF